MKSSFRKYVTWALCLVFGTGIAPGSFGGVLCVGDDGQARVELLCRFSCGDYDKIPAIAQSAAAHDHCEKGGNCFDYPLDGKLLSIRRPIGWTGDPGKIQFGQVVPAHLSVIIKPRWLPRKLSFKSPVEQPLLVLLSTIVLIC